MEVKNLMQLGELFKNSFEVYKERVWVLLGLLAIGILSYLAVLPGVIVLAIGGFTFSYANGINFLNLSLIIIGGILFLVGAVLATIIMSLTQVASLYALKERESKIGIKQSLNLGWPKIWSFLWISLLVMLACLGGMILLVIPGIIFMVWFYFSLYVFVCEDLKGSSALKRSKELVKGYWWPIFGRILILVIAVSIISSVPFFGSLVNTFIMGPASLIYIFLMYEDLKRAKA